MTQPTKNKIPGPVYAAAGAGDLAYQKLRKLPEVLNVLTGRAAAGTAELRERAVANSADLRERARTAAASLRAANAAAAEAAGEAAGERSRERLRKVARRNAAAFVTGAQAAQERATAVYEDLVARGARVIGGSAGTVTAAAELESEGASPALPAGTTPAAKPVKPAEAVKDTRPTGDN
jgi:heparin binding hemagglutinin HbhA